MSLYLHFLTFTGLAAFCLLFLKVFLAFPFLFQDFQISITHFFFDGSFDIPRIKKIISRVTPPFFGKLSIGLFFPQRLIIFGLRI